MCADNTECWVFLCGNSSRFMHCISVSLNKVVLKLRNPSRIMMLFHSHKKQLRTIHKTQTKIRDSNVRWFSQKLEKKKKVPANNRIWKWWRWSRVRVTPTFKMWSVSMGLLFHFILIRMFELFNLFRRANEYQISGQISATSQSECCRAGTILFVNSWIELFLPVRCSWSTVNRYEIIFLFLPIWCILKPSHQWIFPFSCCSATFPWAENDFDFTALTDNSSTCAARCWREISAVKTFFTFHIVCIYWQCMQRAPLVCDTEMYLYWKFWQIECARYYQAKSKSMTIS